MNDGNRLGSLNGDGGAGSGETWEQAVERAESETNPGLGYSIKDALRNPGRTIGRTSRANASKLFDELQNDGWTVGPNAKGTGTRAYDGKGNAIILEENVSRSGAPIHPELPRFYWRISVNGKIFRFGAR
jgi:hypothetical protein